MSLIHDIRTTIDKTGRSVTQTVTDATPVLAAVGATDLAVEKARALGERARARRASVVELDPKELPALTLNRGLELAAESQKAYADLATRGKDLVGRVRTQKATQDLVRQAESTVTLGKGAVTTVRNSAAELQRSAKATITTGRREAAKTLKTVDAVADTFVEDAQVAAQEVSESATASAKRTRTAAKRTSTTAKKSAASTKRATKATTTSARKTATGTRKATRKATTKVGA